ncbi:MULTISPECIES: hypothetical protein [unclassified Streptomyces]|uniref:hypothetical protein n=1 Tax=Streptomyces sp. SID4948 TaxID=2690287 RepID=UPI001F20ACE5|nr:MULTISPECIES: hypothetical protein [unclassified Streptomyces]
MPGDLPLAVHPAQIRVVVAGLDRLDGALGAGDPGRPTFGRARGGLYAEDDELGVQVSVVAVDSDDVVVRGVVAGAARGVILSFARAVQRVAADREGTRLLAEAAGNIAAAPVAMSSAMASSGRENHANG